MLLSIGASDSLHRPCESPLCIRFTFFLLLNKSKRDVYLATSHTRSCAVLLAELDAVISCILPFHDKTLEKSAASLLALHQLGSGLKRLFHTTDNRAPCFPTPPVTHGSETDHADVLLSNLFDAPGYFPGHQLFTRSTGRHLSAKQLEEVNL